MPRKNIVKTYVEHGIYHVYNRGIDKQTIFKDDQDYSVFLGYLKTALSPSPSPVELLKSVTFKGRTFKGIPRQPRNFHTKVKLLAYCLVPNHFHLLIQQHPYNELSEFLRSIMTRYVIYFNKRYKRTGGLFESVYKAVHVKEESYLLHLSRYIHRNPKAHISDLTQAYSSYGDYVGLRSTPWIHTSTILSFFHPGNFPTMQHIDTYRTFVEYDELDSGELLGRLTLEEEE